ncbi:MAG: ABC transporter ATP-binding protein [Ilumatobacteraceae bacterium]
MDSSAPAVALRGLTKVYGGRAVVDSIDLDIPRGSFFGLVGPNGAGKSTTLKMCTTLVRPDGGGVWIDGSAVWDDVDATKRTIGVLPDDVLLFERLTGRESLVYQGLFRGFTETTSVQRTTELLEAFGLVDDADRLVIDYSTGMRKKLGIALALLHAPSVVFLDEPFESVDPVSAAHITSVLQGFCRRGGTVVLSSHVMDTVEKLCDRLAVIHQGRVIAGGATDEVRAGRSLQDVFVELVGGNTQAGDLTWLQSGTTSGEVASS